MPIERGIYIWLKRKFLVLNIANAFDPSNHILFTLPNNNLNIRTSVQKKKTFVCTQHVCDIASTTHSSIKPMPVPIPIRIPDCLLLMQTPKSYSHSTRISHTFVSLGRVAIGGLGFGLGLGFLARGVRIRRRYKIQDTRTMRYTLWAVSLCLLSLSPCFVRSL